MPGKDVQLKQDSQQSLHFTHSLPEDLFSADVL